jgi:methyltransferase, FkbM family
MHDVIALDGISYRVALGQNKTFWDLVKGGGWETRTFRFFRENITPETLVLDVGAWIGPTAFYAAQFGERCIAFEPDPVAFAELQDNVRANEQADWVSRITIANAAITVDGGPLSLGSRSGGGDSMSSALFADEDTRWVVPSKRLQDVLQESAKPGQPVFIKIDIEGGEYTLIPAIEDILAREGVTIHLSLHPRFLRRSLRKKYANLLWPLRFIAARCEFVNLHAKLLSALPKNKRLDIEGRNSTRNLLPVAALMGRFPKEIRIT